MMEMLIAKLLLLCTQSTVIARSIPMAIYSAVRLFFLLSSFSMLLGRQYTFPTFSFAPFSPNHPNRVYVLSKFPSAQLGLRDSHTFFNKNAHMTHIIATDDQREQMIRLGLLPKSLHKRDVHAVAAREIFEKYGHLVVVHGQPKIDDYYTETIPDSHYNHQPSSNHVQVSQSQLNPFLALHASSEIWRDALRNDRWETVDYIPRLAPRMLKAKDVATLHPAHHLYQSAAQSRYLDTELSARRLRFRPTYKRNKSVSLAGSKKVGWLDPHTNVRYLAESTNKKPKVQSSAVLSFFGEKWKRRLLPILSSSIATP